MKSNEIWKPIPNNDDLTCKSNEEYDIVKVLRPKYEVVYEKDKENKLYFSK